MQLDGIFSLDPPFLVNAHVTSKQIFICKIGGVTLKNTADLK